MDSFLTQRASPRQTVVVGFAALLVLLVFALAAPRASEPLRAVGPFMPMCALTVFTTAVIAAFLLAAQFAATRHLVLGALGGAYAFSALAVAVQLLTFPGIFTPTGLLGAGPHTSVWMWVFWHGGFPLFVIVAALIRAVLGPAPVSASDVGPWTWALIGGPIVLCAGLCLIALYGGLPPPFHPLEQNQAFAHGPTALVVWSLNVAALAIVVLSGRLRVLLDQWLLIAMLACLVDTTLNLMSMARFSLGWYVARIFSMLAPGAVVGLLIWEVCLLYRRLFDAHTSLLHVAVRDGLTGVYNRLYFEAQFPKELDRAKRAAQPLSLVIVDVDHFKHYNDTFGHLQGDTCLIAVARALAGVLLRPADFVARYGGEEFAIVLPETDLRGASEVAERARQAVLRLDLETPAPAGRVTISAGCATTVTGEIRLPFDLASAADAALYRAKSAGRNRIGL
ncbi:sensor domain-containing diguanylate cyclase [Trinickia sp.]|uniref:sensor domain-containing diguanylate cyclase n=1 Tax=Trinickia sp. TaxID=2571163 RepID=UPI003F7F0B40